MPAGWLQNMKVDIDASELEHDIERVLMGELKLPTVSAVRCRSVEGRLFSAEIPIYLDVDFITNR